VDPVPDPLLFRKSGSAGNRSRTSGSVARNSGGHIYHCTRIYFNCINCSSILIVMLSFPAVERLIVRENRHKTKSVTKLLYDCNYGFARKYVSNVKLKLSLCLIN
jgi:hypothetical protein